MSGATLKFEDADIKFKYNFDDEIIIETGETAIVTGLMYNKTKGNSYQYEINEVCGTIYESEIKVLEDENAEPKN